MPRRTRTYLVGKKENRQRRDRERELEQLAVALRREWQWLPHSVGRREAA
ncbi:MAG: hypothetical protein LC808_06285 [Actinobacteria bacterium]|nr:hypothetical protein [Actinomycetota bacterium]